MNFAVCNNLNNCIYLINIKCSSHFINFMRHQPEVNVKYNLINYPCGLLKTKLNESVN